MVLLLDLDGTLVGKVNSLVCEYEMHMALAQAQRLQQQRAENNKSGGAGRNSNGNGNGNDADAPPPRGAVSKAVKESIIARLRYGIIRPHVHEFCRSLPPGVELFVYTASDTAWATFFVPCIETALDVRFNRPIFTRKNCVEFRKSITRLQPALLRALRGKYQCLRSVADLRDRVLLIDNTADVMQDARETSRVVVCPTYTYNYIYDVLGRMDVDVLHRKFMRLMPVLASAGLYPAASRADGLAGQARGSDRGSSASNSYQRFSAIYHRHLSRALAVAMPGNLAVLAGDRFWLRLLHALQSLLQMHSPRTQGSGAYPACLTEAAVAELNRAVGWVQPKQVKPS